MASLTNRPTEDPKRDDLALEREVAELTARLDPVPQAVIDLAREAFNDRNADESTPADEHPPTKLPR